MNNNEKSENKLSQKEKIRQRYKGVDFDELDVIPALPQAGLYDETNEKRVAVYARVSTDDPRQTSSYELQKNHYLDVVSRHPGWKLVEIYADEGISGTSLSHRDAFIKMIDDCHAGKIDLIVTKSVSRFARNVLDCIGYVRQLAALNPPIGVFFETENIYTLSSNSEMSLSFISTLAQEESHNKSEIMNASIEMRFRRGIFLTPPLLGFDQNEHGELVINEEEAKTVRLIFFMYLYGYTCQEIAKILTDLKRKTKLGNTSWSANTVLQQLENERHCGDVLARKTYTPNYLDHKSKKNKQNRNQYRRKGHHEAIISRSDFIAVQRLIASAKHGNADPTPKLHVITTGILKGFVTVHPRWAAFKSEDYKKAYAALCDCPDQENESSVTVESGEFDLRGYEVARAEFFDTANQIRITFSAKSMAFTTECVRKMDSDYVEILVHPETLCLAVRPAAPKSKTALHWSTITNGLRCPRQISGSAFLPNLFELFGWNTNYKYRVIGTRKQYGTEHFLFFNLHDAEALIPNSILGNNEDCDSTDKPLFNGDIKPLGTKVSVSAYPEDWIHSFGNDFYYQAQAFEFAHLTEEDWNTEIKSPYEPEPLPNITSKSDLKKNIDTIILEMKQEESRNE